MSRTGTVHNFFALFILLLQPGLERDMIEIEIVEIGGAGGVLGEDEVCVGRENRFFKNGQTAAGTNGGGVPGPEF